jgi:nitrogen regulatory protein PII
MEERYTMMEQNNLRSLFIIINAGHADEIIEITREHGASGATILNARGNAPSHQVFMGITIDKEKEIVLCLTSATIADKIMLAVKDRAGVNTPAHGICFTLPVDKMIGLSLHDDSGDF